MRVRSALAHIRSSRSAEPEAAARLVAVSDSVLVRYDYAAATPVALSADQVAAIEAFEGRRLRA